MRAIRDYTRAAIEDKFRRALKSHKNKKDKLKEVFEQFGVEMNQQTLETFFMATLRAITFDVVACLECRSVGWREVNPLVEEFKDEIKSTVKEMLG